jgi:hypothetical protein
MLVKAERRISHYHLSLDRSDLKNDARLTNVIPARFKRESRQRFLDSRQRHSGVTRVFEMGLVKEATQ